MKVSVPASAPGFEPVQGASKNGIPILESSSWIRRETVGATVLASTTMVPGLAPLQIPSGPRIAFSDISESPTQRKTTSDCEPTSAGVLQATPSPVAASSAALPGVWDQSATL